VGLQLDRGLYGPLVVEPKNEGFDHDREYTLMLDDWLDGTPGTPDDALEELRSSGGGMMGGMDSGDILYPLYLVNGLPPENPDTLEVRRGERIGLRLMNPAAENRLPLRGGGAQAHRQPRRRPVEPVTVDAVRIGMGERYDVILEADNPGVRQLAAVPEGKGGLARAVLR